MAECFADGGVGEFEESFLEVGWVQGWLVVAACLQSLTLQFEEDDCGSNGDVQGFYHALHGDVDRLVDVFQGGCCRAEFFRSHDDGGRLGVVDAAVIYRMFVKMCSEDLLAFTAKRCEEHGHRVVQGEIGPFA